MCVYHAGADGLGTVGMVVVSERHVVPHNRNSYIGLYLLKLFVVLLIRLDV